MRRTIGFLLAFFSSLPCAFSAVPSAADVKARDAAACARQLHPRPMMSTHVMPPYPPVSIRLGEEGTTRLRVTVGDDGVPTDAVVDQTSGSQRLDDAAASFVKSAWRWEPIVNFCGAPVDLGVSVTWHLKPAGGGTFDGVDPLRMMGALSIVSPDDADYPPEAALMKQSGMSGLLVVLLDTGQAQDVILITPSGTDSLDQKAIQLAKTKFRWTPATLNAKPIGGMMVVMVVWTLPGQPRPDTATLKTFIELMAKSRAVRPPVTAPVPAQ